MDLNVWLPSLTGLELNPVIDTTRLRLDPRVAGDHAFVPMPTDQVIADPLPRRPGGPSARGGASGE